MNDAVVKGRIVTLNLVKMFLRFQVGRAAVQGDLKQFYASIKLVPEQWNLQRVLFRPDLDPNSEVVEAIIKTLIWGVKCVSGQSECSIIKLAERIKIQDLLNCFWKADLLMILVTVTLTWKL